MGYFKLSAVLTDLNRSLDRTKQLADYAGRWAEVSTPPRGVPRFSSRHEQMITELAFLRGFLAWEAFLEESFVLYLLGKGPPKGKPPSRYVSPPNRRVAERLLIPEGWRYVDWTETSKVITRAERFFRAGKPYSPALMGQRYVFDEIKTIRNAIVHSSALSWAKFKGLARRRLGIYPPHLTIGGFLGMTVPRSSPPESYLESYLERIRFAAQRIVPS